MTRRIERVLVAPTAFKGTLGPGTVAAAMATGVRRAFPGAEVVERPLSDGGNGLLEACQRLDGGSLIERRVTGPLGKPVQARLLRRSDEVVVESAEACGLHLIAAGERNPLVATTRGVGELISVALGLAERVVVGLGGSATVDGGTGMARALGWRILDEDGRGLPEGGGALRRLAHLEPPSVVRSGRVVALYDVESRLTGDEGAARVYGPQKGAEAEAVEWLEAGLVRLAEVIEADLGLRVTDLPGSGAAGGLGAGARAFLGAELVSGAAWMLRRARLAEELARADLVVTGEGAFDAQSGMGKVTGKLLEASRTAGVAALLVCGRIVGSRPEGVVALDGGGDVLDARRLTELVESGCRRLARDGRL